MKKILIGLLTILFMQTAIARDDDSILINNQTKYYLTFITDKGVKTTGVCQPAPLGKCSVYISQIRGSCNKNGIVVVDIYPFDTHIENPVGGFGWSCRTHKLVYVANIPNVHHIQTQVVVGGRIQVVPQK